jgi:hypothetical protein
VQIAVLGAVRVGSWFRDDQPGRDGHVDRLARPVGQQIENEASCECTFLQYRTGDRGEVHGTGHEVVVEPDHGDLCRHGDPSQAQRLEGTDGQFVVLGEDRIWPVGAGQEVGHGS